MLCATMRCLSQAGISCAASAKLSCVLRQCTSLTQVQKCTDKCGTFVLPALRQARCRAAHLKLTLKGRNVSVGLYDVQLQQAEQGLCQSQSLLGKLHQQPLLLFYLLAQLYHLMKQYFHFAANKAVKLRKALRYLGISARVGIAFQSCLSADCGWLPILLAVENSQEHTALDGGLWPSRAASGSTGWEKMSFLQLLRNASLLAEATAVTSCSPPAPAFFAA